MPFSTQNQEAIIAGGAVAIFTLFATKGIDFIFNLIKNKIAVWSALNTAKKEPSVMIQIFKSHREYLASDILKVHQTLSDYLFNMPPSSILDQLYNSGLLHQKLSAEDIVRLNKFVNFAAVMRETFRSEYNALSTKTGHKIGVLKSLVEKKVDEMDLHIADLQKVLENLSKK